jgi:hypothetical protein
MAILENISGMNMLVFPSVGLVVKKKWLFGIPRRGYLKKDKDIVITRSVF